MSEGSTDLHLAWKASQTVVEALLGTATDTRDRRRGRPQRSGRLHPQELSTRAALSRLAVKAGGAILRRDGLSETILVSRSMETRELRQGGAREPWQAAICNRRQPAAVARLQLYGLGAHLDQAGVGGSFGTFEDRERQGG